MNDILFQTNRFADFDIETLIDFLRERYDFKNELKVVIANDKSKNFRGEAKENFIWINSAQAKNEIEFRDTIIHEFVHVHQIATGALTWRKDGEMMWHGQINKRWSQHPLTAPWEIDAIMETIEVTMLMD